MAPNISSIIEKNVQYSKLAAAAIKPVAVFVGATSGLGEHTAYAFAKYTHKPTIYIVGRNPEAGARVLKKLQEINPDPESKYYFLRHDVTLISEADKLSKEISANESKVNLLFISSGFLTMNGRTENKEGLDTKLSVNYYGRWRIIENLLPLVQKANAAGSGGETSTSSSTDTSKINARVVSLLAPGNEGPVIEDDLDLKHNFTLRNANRHITEFNSLAVERFAQKYPDIGFIHAGPGVVKTGIMRELPWYIRAVSAPLMYFASTVEDAAERFFYVSSTSPEYRTGAHIIDGSLKSVREKAQEKGYLSPQLQEKVWTHTEQMFKDALAKDGNTKSSV